MAQNQDRPIRKKVADFCRQTPGRYPVCSVLLGIIILVLIIWFIPYWQVPKSGLSLKDRLHQINENRKTVAQIVGGAFFLLGLYFTWKNFVLTQEKYGTDLFMAQEKQATDLFTKAIEQLGNGKLQIRLGGIYALERIARESPKDHWTIMEVLTAFVRVNAPLREETAASKAKEEETADAPEASEKTVPPPPSEKPSQDLQAVLTVLGRTAIPYAQKGETRSLDLRATHLAGADLSQSNLQGVLLGGANLHGAILLEVNLQKAVLECANLRGADLLRANLQEANLKEADLQGADLLGAKLQEVTLREANLEGASLWAANLQGANLWGANLQEANLSEANLQEAYLLQANLQRANLSGTNLQRASLLEAKLQGASFATNLHEAVLDDANLQGADFQWAKGLTADQVADAVWDETTKWPKGFSPPARQGNEEEKK